jgi:hypothetical protein
VEGYYCYFGDAGASQGGICTNNADKAQPAQDGSYPDGGLAPMLDAPAVTDTNTSSADSDNDTAAAPETTPPTDTGAPKDASPPNDTGAQDASSSG